jgi:fructose-bisphosphate aldolase class I
MKTAKTAEMRSTAKALVAFGRGILAADESVPTIGARFAACGIESSAESRRAYREMLFTTPHIAESISGVILFDETIHQFAHDEIPMVDVLRRQGIIPGVKVDRGAKPLALFPGETITEGLDGLRERLEEYRELGARFAKWRAVLKIGHQLPTMTSIAANANLLAPFAALSQEAGLVPIVEPEVLRDGDHTLSRCEEVTSRVLRTVFQALGDYRVELEAVILKPNMVTPGTRCIDRISTEQIAEATLHCLRGSVPSHVPGVVFLSGGQTEVEATERLNAINLPGMAPWELSFSFGRALQETALRTWNGLAANGAEAQAAFADRARLNAFARNGLYDSEMEKNQHSLVCS